jgi:hypothetical protein
MVGEQLDKEKSERIETGSEPKKRKTAVAGNWAAGPSSAGSSGSKWNYVGDKNTNKIYNEAKEHDYAELFGSSDDDSGEDQEWEDVDLDTQGL